jgi:hypothetical protein
LPLLQIIKIIPKQIHIQLKKYKINKKNKRKKKLRTAIEWDYGILPPSSIKGLPTDKNVRSIDLPKNTSKHVKKHPKTHHK